MKIPLRERLKKLKFPKLNVGLKLPNLDKKKTFFVIAIAVILLISILGRKSPTGNDWESVLPAADIFDGPIEKEFEMNKHTAFYFEVYDLVKNRFWNVMSDEQLGNLTKLAIEKITEKEITEIPKSRAEIDSLINKTMENMNDEEKKNFIVQLSDLLLANLEPFGRSRLYTSKKQKELSDTVTNKAQTDHYSSLGVNKEATSNQIALAYTEKFSELNAKPQSEETAQEKAQLEIAFEVLGDEGNRKVYDELGVNPTIDNRLISPGIFYIHITKFSPTTVEELQRVMDKVDQGEILDTLIVDLRGNIGGAIDGLPFFLGPFIGAEQHAYQFFSRGNKQDFITKTGWMPSMIRYKKVVVLTDGQAQSSAEVFASVLKKYNVGILVGEPTKGWGTVESVFRINNQLDPENEEYSVLLVHSLTLREDGVPIEGKGVDPAVIISNPNWEKEFNKYFNYPELTTAVRNLIR